MLIVYGYSDDLIEVEGDVTEEFTYRGGHTNEGDLLAFADGTLLRIRFDDKGVWRITPVARGSAELSIEQCTENIDDSYSDRATFDAQVAWVVHGIDHAPKR